MKESERYCFLAFGELALDVTYKDNLFVNEVGGVSAFNTLYNLSIFGEKAYAIGGVGADVDGVKALESLKHSLANVDYIQFLNKPTNVFYMYKLPEVSETENSVDIDRSYVKWSNKLCTKLPKEFENRNVILIVSNFEKVTKAFIEEAKIKCKDCKVSLDITNANIFSEFSNGYIYDFLRLVDFIQCNESTSQAIFSKLNIDSPEEFFAKVMPQVLTITKGSKGATFLYRSNGQLNHIDKYPNKVAPILDSTGAGDAFHAMFLMSYHRKLLNNSPQLDEEFFNKAFKVANALSRKIVQIEGARGSPSELLNYMLNEVFSQIIINSNEQER